MTRLGERSYGEPAGSEASASILAGEDLAGAIRAGEPIALQAVVETYLPQILRAARGAESRFAADGSWSRPPAAADAWLRLEGIRRALADCLRASPTAQRMAFFLRKES